MINSRARIALILAVVLGVIAALSFKATMSRGQSPETTQATSENLVKPTALVRDRKVESTVPLAYVAAANLNSSLRNELAWQFGRKNQRGWYLYSSLLAQLLNTNDDSSSANFAVSLKRWQEGNGITANGILDDQTLYAIIGNWQKRRLQDKTPASPDQLITAPPSDFYDPERLPELRQVERQTYAAYKKMVAAALSDPSLSLASNPNAKSELAASENFLKILSSYRSREYQEKLRRESPHAGSAGLAVNSPHFTGRALDLYVGGEPVETNDANRAIQVKTPVYQWLVRNAERFGFRPYFYEPWHWEYVGNAE